MTRRIVFLAEGTTDIGRKRTPDDLISEISGGPITHFVGSIIRDRIGSFPDMECLGLYFKNLRQHRGRPSWAAKIERFISILWQSHGKYVGAAAVRDEDGTGRTRLNEMQHGRTNARNQGMNTPLALGLAVREMEAWLIADEQAILSELDLSVSGGSPESDSDPKATFGGIYETYCDNCSQAGEDAMGRTKAMNSIAAAADPSRLASRCSIGFGPFKEDVEREIAPIFR